eukprot:2740212-Rhodomonas_salina.1
MERDRSVRRRSQVTRRPPTRASLSSTPHALPSGARAGRAPSRPRSGWRGGRGRGVLGSVVASLSSLD